MGYNAQGKFIDETIMSVSIDELIIFEHFANTSCYGATAASVSCTSCQDVVNAYTKRGWEYNKSAFDQCKPAPPSAPTGQSCYGATTADVACPTCSSVISAYQKKGWAYNQNNFAQCATPSPPPVPAGKSCYGANSGICNSCDDVIAAYEARGWGYDRRNFAQCTLSNV